jgi:hypothetical protein
MTYWEDIALAGRLPARRKRLGLHVLHQAFCDLEDLPRIVVRCEAREPGVNLKANAK